jgi:DNA polymerase-3 subunit epsilon
VTTPPLERTLTWAIVGLFVVPTVLAEACLVLLYRRGVFPDTWGLLLTVLIGFAAVMAALAWMAHAIGRPLACAVRVIKDGAELMTTVNPDHRIDVRTGDELEALAANVNRLADQLRDARGCVETRVAEGTQALAADRDRLAAILGALGDGVVVASADGRVTLANAAARDLLAAGRPIVGSSLSDLVAAPDISALLAQVGGGDRSGRRFSVSLPNGGAAHVSMTALRMDGQPAGVILAVAAPNPAGGRDIDEPVVGGEPASQPFVGMGFVSGIAGDVPGPARPEMSDLSLFEEMERRVGPAEREHRLEDLSFVVLDVETTGLRPELGDRIVSLGAVRVRGGAVRAGETFDALIYPERPVPSESTRFHGITDAMVAGAPAIGAVLPAFLRFAEGAVLVGHEASFDMAFLRRGLERLGLPPLAATHPVLDTRLLSRLVHGPEVAHTLEAVAARLGVTVVGRHSALGDATTAAEILVRLLVLLKTRGLVTLGDTLDAMKRVRG